MTEKQKQQFNLMLERLKIIAKGYQTTDRLREISQKRLGPDYKETLEIAYKNIREEAISCIKGIREIK